MEDASTLRWILIIAGAALIGGLLLFGNPNKKPKRRKPKRRKPNRRKPASSGRQEPTLDGGDAPPPEPEPSRFEDPAFSQPPPAETDQGELPIGNAGPVEPTLEPPAPSESTAAEPPAPEAPAPDPGPPMDPPEKVVVLYLQARDNRKVAGVELLDAAVKSGMDFGAMNIFHRMVEGHDQPLFSMANLENPGHFDKGSWPTLETRGMTLFMGLPGPMGALYTWDAMVAAARRMSELLHLDILDQRREPFTRLREGEIREELREFERQQLPEG